MTDLEKQSLRFVLDGLTFPAERWEILAAADFYGADVHTSRRLRGLPVRDRPYRDLQEVLHALDSA
ncbi:MAG TPA: DUF2795 domain-containing protein [Pseudonocardiaceae bacterium]|jgi:hypothetical protein|nr:DUF2795 domain-containing protein [Pseudonocardiaceae bacterium]